jgi:CheY-like chemotaxis protein
MKKILVVEDHPDTQSLLCDLLELEGFEVRSSGEAQGVLGLARRMRPDLILLDVRLPGINGIELLKLLNQDRQVREVPVLFCSGATELLEENHDAIEKSGAKVVTKPFTLDGLIESVHQTLAQGQRHPDDGT